MQIIKDGDKMKKRDLFLDKIQIDDIYSMQIDPNTLETVNIYENNQLIEQFSLKRRIFTLFKTLQKYINSDDSILDKERNIKLYGKEIPIKEDIFMKVSDEHKELIVKFYHKQDEKNVLYLTKMNYMTQKLFHNMLIPKKVIENPKYQLLNPKEFKDLMDILSVIKI